VTSQSFENACLQETQHFLARIEALRKGPLHELGTLLAEAKSLQRKVLQATTAAVEKEALKRVEVCYDSAGHVASRAAEALQDLSAETSIAIRGGSSQADLRRQSLAGTSSKLKTAVEAVFQAQREFREALEAKRSRQLRVAFPDASQEAVDAIAARNCSAAAAIQDTVTLQPGSGTNPLRTATAMMATHEDLSDLQDLARSARMLKMAFEQADLLINVQGETIDDIESQVSTAVLQTAQANEHLALAERSQRICRKKLYALLIGVLVAVAVLVAMAVVFKKKI